MLVVLDSLNLAKAEQKLCTEALDAAGSIVEAANLLGITRHALKRRIIKHDIQWPPPSAQAQVRDGHHLGPHAQPGANAPGLGRMQPVPGMPATSGNQVQLQGQVQAPQNPMLARPPMSGMSGMPNEMPEASANTIDGASMAMDPGRGQHDNRHPVSGPRDNAAANVYGAPPMNAYAPNDIYGTPNHNPGMHEVPQPQATGMPSSGMAHGHANLHGNHPNPSQPRSEHPSASRGSQSPSRNDVHSSNHSGGHEASAPSHHVGHEAAPASNGAGHGFADCTDPLSVRML